MKMQQGIMGSHASPDLYIYIYIYIWISAEKIQDQQNSSTHLWGGVPPEKKSAEILGPNIESAEVHCTKPEDEFRPGMGLNTKLRGQKKQQKSGTSTQFV